MNIWKYAPFWLFRLCHWKKIRNVRRYVRTDEFKKFLEELNKEEQ